MKELQSCRRPLDPLSQDEFACSFSQLGGFEQLKIVDLGAEKIPICPELSSAQALHHQLP